MQVTSFEITDLPSLEADNRLRANVILISGDNQFQFLCDLPREGLETNAQERSALLRDALRQLRRLPEFRCGSASIDTILPTSENVA